MVHSIISDEAELAKFVATLDPKGRYLVQLAIRNKYADYQVSKNYNVLRKQFLPTSKIISFIKQMESPVGSYSTHKGDVITNDTGFVVYISANALEQEAAYRKMLCELANMISFSRSLPRHAEEFVHTALFKSNVRDVLDIEFDFDDKSSVEETKKSVIDALGASDIVRFINTRGGIHCLINTKQIPLDKKKSAIKTIKKLPFVDITGSQMSHAVPGTFQGLHPVTMD